MSALSRRTYRTQKGPFNPGRTDPEAVYLTFFWENPGGRSRSKVAPAELPATFGEESGDTDGSGRSKGVARKRGGGEGPVFLPPVVLSKLTVDDLPNDTFVQMGVPKDGVMHVEWSGRLYREADQVVGVADYTWTRKYWYAPIGLEQYLDLVRRAVEVRQKTQKGDVSLSHFDDDSAYIHLSFAVQTGEKNLGRAYDSVRKICSELEKSSERI